MVKTFTEKSLRGRVNSPYTAAFLVVFARRLAT